MDRGDLINGRYRLGEMLGRGGMSVVWRADDEVLGREVAVKVLSAALADDPGLRQRIRAEARAAAGLRHPGIVEVFDYSEFTEAGRTLSYVVMELVEGRSMDDMLTAGRLPWRLAVLIGAQVAAALAAAHRAGIVHRDVKPGNVMVTATGVKLVDFGISATVGELDGQDGIVLGTPAYLAPERVTGQPVRPATDVYALGLLLYRALAGQMPWNATTVTQMVKAHVYTSPAPLPAVPGLPAEARRLLERSLAKKPGDRPSSGEIAETLGGICGLPPQTLMRTAAVPTVALPLLRRRRPRQVLVGAAAAGVLALSAAWWSLDEVPVSPQAAAATPTSTPATSTSSSPSPSATVFVRVVDRPTSEKTTAAPAPEAKAAHPAAPKPAGPKPPKPAKPPKPPKVKPGK
ncbi:serine/threonine-protein kinase [Actinoplanes sp. HUAS TT8]|uniref:serine/threonine-protein kinase n=1 Tax=Actinoplanes sp. HUAS TT8 TaxID=3447453 RepID=UPI003F528F86